MTTRLSLLAVLAPVILAVLAPVILGLAVLAGPALAADGPPRLDIETTCKSAARAQVGISGNASEDGCLRSERGAHDELKKRWGEFPASAKSQCSQQFEAGGSPSYVELMTCLELASGSAPAQTGGKAANSDVGGGGSSEKKTGSTLTREPPPSQRTNPIDVLRDK